MVALLKKLGVDYVLDTAFTADLTIVEEASELIERVVNKTKSLPQFTSCCTAKKFEIRRNEMNSAGKYLGIDSLTFSFHYVKIHRSSYFFILVFHFITMC